MILDLDFLFFFYKKKGQRKDICLKKKNKEARDQVTS